MKYYYISYLTKNLEFANTIYKTDELDPFVFCIQKHFILISYYELNEKRYQEIKDQI